MAHLFEEHCSADVSQTTGWGTHGAQTVPVEAVDFGSRRCFIPTMRVVSSNTEEDLARERARYDAEFAMRNLTANILRIVRGAGAPHELRRQMHALEEAMQAHWAADRTWPISDIAAAVYLREEPENWEQYSEANRAEWYAERQILSGALRYVAGEIIGPRVQASHGSSEMHGGIRELERVRDAENKRWRAENATPAMRRASAAGALAAAKAIAKAKVAKKPRKSD